MTDNEIIKALKECEECHYYNDCPSLQMFVWLCEALEASSSELLGI